jgi:hypothetical protein
MDLNGPRQWEATHQTVSVSMISEETFGNGASILLTMAGGIFSVAAHGMADRLRQLHAISHYQTAK